MGAYQYPFNTVPLNLMVLVQCVTGAGTVPVPVLAVMHGS